MPPTFWISQAEEKNRYLQHKNERTNKGYVVHLLGVVASVEKYVSPMGTGLDYGCGPSPLLGELLRERGFSCIDYDPIFYPTSDFARISKTFDFIVSCEAAEHFREPLQEWKEMVTLINPGGAIIVFTKTVEDPCSVEEFKRWWYIRDSTHISFYTKSAVQLLAKHIGVSVQHFSEDGFVMIKPK